MNIKTSRDLLKNMIRIHEGTELYPYTDGSGKTTIGIGRNLSSNGISLDEALILFEADISRCEKELSKYDWFNNLDEVRKGVIIELNFNIGLTSLLKFKKMIEYLKIFDYEGATQEMLRSNWETQVSKSRSKNMASRLLNGVYKT